MKKYFMGHSHTDYSNLKGLDSINKVSNLIEKAIERGLSGLAITEHDALCSHVVARNYLKNTIKKEENKEIRDEDRIQKLKDFKLVLGNEIYLVRNGLNKDNYRKGEDRYWHFILLAKDAIGHEQLRRLSSRAWSRSFRQFIERVPTYYSDIDEIVGSNPGHLIASTACLGSFFAHLVMNRKKSLDDAAQLKEFLDWGTTTFKNDFYIELQPSHSKEQVDYNKQALIVAAEWNIPVTITTDAHYLDFKDRTVHKAFLQSNDTEREIDSFYSSTYIMDWETIIGYCHYIPDFEMETIRQNTLSIQDKCTKYSLDSKQSIPRIPHGKIDYAQLEQEKEKWKGFSFIENFLNSTYEDDLVFIERILKEFNVYCAGKDSEWVQLRKERLEQECEELWEVSIVIEERLSAYLTTMSKLIDIAWEDAKTIVGPGRGSSYTMFTCFLLGIIQADPLDSPIPLPSWRFLHRERPELADIDTDFQSTKKDFLIEKVSEFFESFGGHAVRIITFATETSKAALNTAARGLGYEPEIGTYLSSLVSVDRGQVRSLTQSYFGDEKIAPSATFVEEMNRYADIWEVAQNIEGLISRRGVHACGLLLTNNDFEEKNAYMKSPSGALCSQFELHDSEQLGCIKYDFLVTDALDRIAVAMKLLLNHGYIEWQGSLRETYNKYFFPNRLDYSSPDMWKMAADGKIISLFQFETAIGGQAIRQIQPTSLLELAQANSLMRLMPEGRTETPVEEFIKYKEDIESFLKEIDYLHPTGLEREALLKILLPLKGVADSQESVMMLSMEPALTNFTVGEANKLRKTIAKKLSRDIDSMREFFFKKGKENNCSDAVLKYLWNVQFARQLGYSFSSPHTIAYSTIAIQEMNIAYLFPTVFWNCACLIVDSAGLSSEDDWENDEDEEIEEVELLDEEDEQDGQELVGDLLDKPKKKNKVVNYGKISSAISRMIERGIVIDLPDINLSEFTFTPDVLGNRIIFGIKGITKINSEIANKIIENRPYLSLDDFQAKVRLGKLPMINLIKSGCFDNVEQLSRVQLLEQYFDGISDKKKRLTMQNLAMLVRYNLIPVEFDFQRKLFHFTKYLRTLKEGELIFLDSETIDFYCENFNVDILKKRGEVFYLSEKEWKKQYDKAMLPLKERLKVDTNLLTALNEILYSEVAEKYGTGNISRWEMDSVNFYHHEHELANVNTSKYEIRNFFDQSPNPVVDKIINIKGKQIPLLELWQIIGTVIDKNKMKNTITLSTPDGVVDVKIYKAQFSKYDKQLFEKQPDGTKKVLEKSWFSRGNKLLLTGIRRDNIFIPKVYAKSFTKHPIQLIEEIDDCGEMIFANPRAVGS